MKVESVERGVDYFKETEVYARVQGGTATDEERWELAQAAANHVRRLDSLAEAEAEVPSVRGIVEERLGREAEIMRRDRVIPKWLQPDSFYPPSVDAATARLAKEQGRDPSAA